MILSYPSSILTAGCSYHACVGKVRINFQGYREVISVVARLGSVGGLGGRRVPPSPPPPTPGPL